MAEIPQGVPYSIPEEDWNKAIGEMRAGVRKDLQQLSAARRQAALSADDDCRRAFMERYLYP